MKNALKCNMHLHSLYWSRYLIKSESTLTINKQQERYSIYYGDICVKHIYRLAPTSEL